MSFFNTKINLFLELAKHLKLKKKNSIIQVRAKCSIKQKFKLIIYLEKMKSVISQIQIS